VSAFSPLRVSEEEEKIGIDLAFHGEIGYRYVHHEIGEVMESHRTKKDPFAFMIESKASGD
jgi:hypothetical protein